MVNIKCFSCDAPYQVDDRRVPAGGLKMRCPKCAALFWLEIRDDVGFVGPALTGDMLGAPAPTDRGTVHFAVRVGQDTFDGHATPLDLEINFASPRERAAVSDAFHRWTFEHQGELHTLLLSAARLRRKAGNPPPALPVVAPDSAVVSQRAHGGVAEYTVRVADSEGRVHFVLVAVTHDGRAFAYPRDDDPSREPPVVVFKPAVGVALQHVLSDLSAAANLGVNAELFRDLWT